MSGVAKHYDKNTNKKVIEGFSCPKCKSKKGEPCTSYSGRKLHVAHKDRYEVYWGLQKLNAEEKAAKEQGFDQAVAALETTKNPSELVSNFPSYDDVVSTLMGRSPDEQILRNKLVAQVEGGLCKLIDLVGKDEAMFKIAEAIVDGKTDVFKIRNS